MNDEDTKHIAYVILHNGLLPEEGFGGCSCEICESLRAYIRAQARMEALEFEKEYMHDPEHSSLL